MSYIMPVYGVYEWIRHLVQVSNAIWQGLPYVNYWQAQQDEVLPDSDDQDSNDVDI